MTTQKILVGAFVYAWYYRLTLMKLLAVPVALQVLAEALRVYAKAAEGASWAVPVRLLAPVAYACLMIVVAILVHRVILLGAPSGNHWGVSWTRRETRYLLYTLGVILAISPLLLLTVVPYVGGILALIAAGYVVSRLSVMFPGIAVDRPLSFRVAWETSKQYGGLLFIVVALVPWVLTYLPEFLKAYSYTLPLGVLLEAFVMVYGTAALSLAYRQITSEGHDDPSDGDASGGPVYGGEA